MKFKLLAGAAIAASLVASGAAAQDWYGALDLGYHWSDDSSFETTLGKVRIDPDDDWVGFARLGYQLSDHWRVEMEGGYRPGTVPTATPGSFEVFSLMGNVIVDFNPEGDLHPYLGLGAGIARAQADYTLNPTILMDDDDAAWAWQAIAGVTAKASDRMQVDFTYRYFQTGDFDFKNTGTAGPLSGSYNDQSVDRKSVV